MASEAVSHALISQCIMLSKVVPTSVAGWVEKFSCSLEGISKPEGINHSSSQSEMMQIFSCSSVQGLLSDLAHSLIVQQTVFKPF